MKSGNCKYVGWAAVTFVEASPFARPDSAIGDEAVSHAGWRSALGPHVDAAGDLIEAIAAELSRLRGGSVQQQLHHARQLLDSAFRSIEAGRR